MRPQVVWPRLSDLQIDQRADGKLPRHKDQSIDLRRMTPPPHCLDPDPAVGYPAGQTLAKHLRSEGVAALIYPSVRRAGGTCLVAFLPHVVQNVRPGARWKLSWQGTPAWTATVV